LISANPGFLWTVLSFLLLIGPLIFIHELGHYFVGRWFGVKADVFSIGFGRELIGWTDRRGTRWKVAALPLGGYVKFAGDMNPASQASPEWLMLPAEERARTFQAKPVFQRFLIVLAGPMTNLAFALLVFTALNLAYGEFDTPPVIHSIKDRSPAWEAGLRPGDRIAAIDSKTISRFEDIVPQVVLVPGQTLTIDAVRSGQPLRVRATIRELVDNDAFGHVFKRGVLGISPKQSVVVRPGPVQALTGAFADIRQALATSLQGLGQIVTGKRSVKDLGGPLKIAQFSGERASLGWLPFVAFMGIISINLGFINLLPIPMLDGGHLLFYAIEAVRREPLKPEAQEWAFRTGLAALLALMILVTLNDLASFGLWAKLGGLIG
jgi:regulator of sigma E protease